MTEWNAADYARHSSLQEAMAGEQLSRLVLQGDERVLDVGCGDGKVTAKIAARVPRGSVLGVDPSRSMVEFAASRYGPPAYPNLRFEVADARNLPYRDEFNLVVSFNALHWVHEAGAALRSIRATLKPGGRALLRFVPKGPRQSLEDVIEETCRSPHWGAYFTDHQKPYAHFTPQEYRTFAEQARLRVLHLERHDRAWDFQTRDGFVAFCQGTFGVWSRRLPDARRLEFITDVLDRYQAVAGQASVFKFYQLEAELARGSD